MPYESHREAQILNRCWTVYSLLINAFSPSDTFHLGFPSLVETAIISSDLQINLPVEKGFILLLREEYEFTMHNLVINSYSYNLIDNSGNSILRCDCLPYHQTDYKRHKLTHPPHHLHDKLGRICSFAGELKDFIDLVKNVIDPQG